MKLISLYIENFGCLHQYDLEFRDGLTVIREPNGFGKTTLAEFIRAMFYGFPRAAKTLDKNKRKKYIPWSGGKCGGHLTFEYEGTLYRIERSFGATPRGDSFNLIDLTTNKKSDRFSEDIGVELFQLDADSFERSTYMPQLHDLGSLSTDSIRAKLGDLVEDTNDVGNFDKAVAALKNKRSTFIPYRGSGGTVAQARSQVSRYQEELDRTERKRETLAAVQVEIAGLNGQLEENERELAAVRAQITRASQAAAVSAVRRQYEDLLARRQQAAEAVQESHFADGVPSAEAFDAAERDCEQYLSLNAELRSVGLSPAEQAQLEELERFFAAGIPGEKELETLSAKVQKQTQLRLTAAHQSLSPDEQKRLEALEDYFAAGVPGDQEIDEIRDKRDRMLRLRQERDSLMAALEGAPKEQPGGRGGLLMLVIGILALAVGAVLMACRGVIPGGILLGTGLAALIVGAALGRRGAAAKARFAEAEQMRARVADYQREADALWAQVRAFTERYSKNQSAAEVIPEIRNNRASYLALRVRADAMAEGYERTEQDLAVCTRELNEALVPYFGTRYDPERAVQTLWLRCRQIQELKRKKADEAVREKEICRQMDRLQAKLHGFLAEWGRESGPEEFRSQLIRLRRDCDAHTWACTRLAGLEAQIAAFQSEHQAELEALPAEEGIDPDTLKEKEKELTAEISALTRTALERKQTASQLRGEIDRIPEIRDALERWQNQKDADQKKAEMLDETLEYLQKARESLSGNYLGTIQRSVGAYLGRMMDGEKALVTSDLEVQLERQGQTRELSYFSAGQRDLVMLCMRLALVDALFSDVKPFVILDDPFVNLDDERTAEALALLKDLAQERQIIYLVCNSSRA